LQPHAAVRIAEQHAAQTVPLNLEEILGRAERSLGGSGLHRPHLGGKALQLYLELIGFLQPAVQLRRQWLMKLYVASREQPAFPFPCPRAASWPARPIGAAPPSGP